MPIRAAALLALCLFIVPASAAAQDLPAGGGDLAGLDIDELARIEITSVSRKAEPVANATAAVSVLTREDIRRSGAATLPDVLRMVPGLQVARVGSRDWAVSARGFNAQSANKLLLLVDGRSVYSPIFAGVFWDGLAFPMDEIDRIEIIRGPGATLWGANAVNGVVNVITRPAGQSRGGRVALGAGTRLNVIGGARYGGRIGSTDFRINGGGRNRDPSLLGNGDDAFDDWTFGQVGVRLDGELSPRDTWTLQGDAFRGAGDHRLLLPTPEAPHTELVVDELAIDGVNALGRWTRRLSEGSDITVQAYFDRARREQTPLFGTMTVNQLDVDAQHRFFAGERHEIIWGVGYRRLADDVTGATGISFAPASRTTDLWTAFAQDDIALIPERLSLTLGAKLEHNDYSGAALQPNVRALWRPSPVHSMWGSVSRAVRTPSRIDADAVAVAAIPGSPVQARLIGSDDYGAEELIAYELGYRLEPAVSLSFDAAAFYNSYDQLRTIAPGAPTAPEGDDPRPVVAFDVNNDAYGRSYGFELAGTWRASRHVRLRGSYSRLELRTALDPGAPANSSPEAADGLDAEQSATAWLTLDLPAGLELDVLGRHVGELRARGVPSYTTADVRVGWRWRNRLELSLIGQDLLEERHAEFPTIAFIPDNRFIGRRGYAKAVWRF
jgi:iron complex outermembrane receptor protein